MRKSFVLFAVLACCVMAFMTGCKKELKQVRGVVTGVESRGDTLLSISIANGEEKYLFDLSRARFNMGIALRGDSVLINYMEGRKDTLHAYIVTVLPRPTHYLQDMVNKDAPLKTASDTTSTGKK